MYYNHSQLQNKKLSAQALATNGPTLAVEVSIPTALIEIFKKENKDIPHPAAGLALIDTGATRSCVDDDVVTKLGVKPVGVVQTNTASGSAKQNLYPAHFRFPSAKFEVDFSSVAGIDLEGHSVNDKPIIALFGRDILSKLLFIYNGPLGLFTLAA